MIGHIGGHTLRMLGATRLGTYLAGRLCSVLQATRPSPDVVLDLLLVEGVHGRVAVLYLALDVLLLLLGPSLQHGILLQQPPQLERHGCMPCSHPWSSKH